MVTSDLWMAFLCRTSERPPRLSSREKFAKSSGVILRIEREREERERERETQTKSIRHYIILKNPNQPTDLENFF